MPDLSEMFTKRGICQYRFEKLRVAIRFRICYIKKVEELKKQVVSDLHSDESSPDEDKSEAGMLYAEFAMDFATLAMQQALISALSALDSQCLPDTDKADNREKLDQLADYLYDRETITGEEFMNILNAA